MTDATLDHYRTLIDIHLSMRSTLVTVRVDHLKDLLDEFEKRVRVKAESTR